MDRMILIILVFVFTAVAAFSDLRTKKLPNALLVPAFLAGLAYHAICGALQSGLAGSLTSLLHSLAGFGLGFGVLFVLWLIGGGGGGDVKYMGALGAWLGVKLTVAVLLLSALLAVVAGVSVLVWQFCRLGPSATKTRFLSSGTGQPARNSNQRKKKSPEQRAASRRLLPFAVPAGLATWCVLITTEFMLQK